MDGFSDQALKLIRSHRWPGNLRELCNAVERAVILARGCSVAAEDLPVELQSAQNAAVPSADEVKIGSLISLDKLEGAHIQRILERTGSLTEASGVLGIDPATLYRKRKRIGMESPVRPKETHPARSDCTLH
jgi:NtrC-family two-component system response regulator AlgB